MFSSRSFLSTIVLSFYLCAVASANDHVPHRHSLKLLERNHAVAKRFDNSRFTYYEAGLGSCGATNTDNDFIVALNSAQYDGGSHCFETITITYNGKTTKAQITDQCPGCPYGGLDFTPALFSYFASTDEGVIYGEWEFGSGAAPSPSPSPSPEPTPSPSPEPILLPTTTWKPTTTWTPPPPPPTTTTKKHTTSSPPPPPPTTSSSSWSPPPSSAPPSSSEEPTTSSSPSSTSKPPKTSSTPPPSSSSSSTSTSTSSTAPTPTGGLTQLNQALVQLSALLASGGNAH